MSCPLVTPVLLRHQLTPHLNMPILFFSIGLANRHSYKTVPISQALYGDL